MLHCAFIDRGALHTNQEVVLVVNEKDENVLAKAIVLRRHVVLGMRQQSWLEDGSQIRRCHLIDISLCSENGKEIQNVEQQLPVQRGQSLDLVLVYAHGGVWVKAANRRGLSLAGPYSLCLVALEGVSKGIVVLQGDYGLREVVEVAAQNVGGIMHRVAGPVQALSISRRGVEGRLEFLYPLLRAGQAKDALDIGCCGLLTADDATGNWA